MVYSVFYYATEAIVRALASFLLRVHEYMRRRRVIEEKRREREQAPSWGFFVTINPYGAREYTWIGKATSLQVSIPEVGGVKLRIPARGMEKPPTRLYFTFAEAASREWFKEIEWLAEQAERAVKESKSIGGQ